MNKRLNLLSEKQKIEALLETYSIRELGKKINIPNKTLSNFTKRHIRHYTYSEGMKKAWKKKRIKQTLEVYKKMTEGNKDIDTMVSETNEEIKQLKKEKELKQKELKAQLEPINKKIKDAQGLKMHLDIIKKKMKKQ